MLRQIAFPEPEQPATEPGPFRLAAKGKDAILGWASTHALGQKESALPEVWARRNVAIQALLARRPELAQRRVLIRPEWHLLTGAGTHPGPYEFAIALHGTYGWPVIPASTLKGAARAWSEQRGMDKEEVCRVFGSPPHGPVPSMGFVRWTDALPIGDGVRVLIDGFAAHHPDYHREPTIRNAPGESDTPILVKRLVLGSGTLAADLVGPESDVDLAATWLASAGDDLGIGAMSGSGYGYAQVEEPA